jgi:hypothetical protein
MVKNKVRASTRKKLERIAAIRAELKRLAAEVESECGLEGVYDGNHWSIAQYLDQCGPIPRIDDLVTLAETFGPEGPEQ